MSLVKKWDTFYVQLCTAVKSSYLSLKVELTKYSTVGVPGRKQDENVYQEQSSGTYANDDLYPFFPCWGIVLAPAGVITLSWGW